MIELNMVYCMDNLELMKQIDNNYIDLIYCDILYNTGKKFKDYDDNLGTHQEAIEWYKPRLIEMYRILKKTGSIYIHCDYHLSHYIKVLMDEVFGCSNFRNEIIWWYLWGGRGKSSWNSKHDNILFYSKTDKWTFNYLDVLDDHNLISKNSQERVKHKGALVNHRAGKISEIPSDKVLPSDTWYIPTLNAMAKERENYDTQKPKSLLEKIIKASSKEGDIVADFFCGSGTTLVVAKELNKQYIGCDINQRAVEISNERLNKTL